MSRLENSSSPQEDCSESKENREKRPLRIVYIYQYFNTPQMSGGTRTYEMARRLVRAGHTVHVVTSQRTPSREHKGWLTTREDGVFVHWLPIPYANDFSYPKRMLAFFKFAILSASKAASLDSNVVYASSTPLTVAIPGIWTSWRKRVPMVFEVRDLWPDLPIAIGALKNPIARFLARLLERTAYARSALVIALSPGMAEGVARTGYPPERIRVIPNSADLDVFGYSPSAADRFRRNHPELPTGHIFIYPGTLGRINGVGYLAELAAHLRDSAMEATIVVIGGGVEEGHVRNIAVELDVLGKNFFMFGKMSKQEIADAFSAASLVFSCFVDLPEMEANSANKFFDALASGTAVAINYGGWQAELVREYGIGLVLPRDPGIAAEELAQWLAKPGAVSAAGLAARELGKEKFARDNLAAELERSLCKVVAVRSRNVEN